MVSNEFSFEPDLSAKERRELAAFLDETARRAGDPDHLAPSFLRVLATRLDDSKRAAVKIGHVGEDDRLIIRRLVYSARERAAGGETSRAVAGALLALLGAFEAAIGYDRQRYQGTRNIWGEPANLSRTRGLGAVGIPVVR